MVAEHLVINYNYRVKIIGGSGGSGGGGGDQGGYGGAGHGPNVYFGQPQAQEPSAFRAIRLEDIKLAEEVRLSQSGVAGRQSRGMGVRRIYHAESPSDGPSPADGAKGDIIIAVMGCVGSGKSSFIKLLTGNPDVKIATSLESETSEIQGFSFVDRTSGCKGKIIDTPGFDDSCPEMTDTDILKQIANYLCEEYDGRRKLDGLIYVHRITDPRFGGQSIRNLRMFKELCGAETFKNVVVLTTFWDSVSEAQGQKREDELTKGSKFFKDLIAGGAHLMRHDRRTLGNTLQVLRQISMGRQSRESPCDGPSPVDNAKDDIIIAVMGCVGSGKSSFIKLLSGDPDVRIADSLGSETSEVQGFSFVDRTSGRTVTLLDTPGFDDSCPELTDTDILKQIANYLCERYDTRRKLNGLIYVHRIPDSRFGGQSIRNLRMFKELLGAETFKNVVILTTFWDSVSEAQGQKREDELTKDSKFFKDLVAGGAHLMRHNRRTLGNALQVLRHVSTL
ncbi:hypothetical protein MSAN_01515300 [Mycena sanguinolenta]|uniref:G domain-containing protein n=1 Tax=Mycena sanguinolenta TaxID=230812 RepID=A0A8H7CWN4_9AGAR|nr:hypothetical protein MSAN_01515300 [Mycena sanguinolenta]